MVLVGSQVGCHHLWLGMQPQKGQIGTCDRESWGCDKGQSLVGLDLAYLRFVKVLNLGPWLDWKAE